MTLGSGGGRGTNSIYTVGGSGGGGRIAIYSCNLLLPEAGILASGGIGYQSGQAGTIYRECRCSVPTGVAATPASICEGASSQLTATPCGGADAIEWFTDACGSAPVPGGPAPMVSPAATTTYHVRSRNSISGCVSVCVPVTICVTSGPSEPTGAQASPAVVGLAQASQLAATPGAGGDAVEWFTGSCGGSLVPGGTLPIVTPVLTTTYYARSRNETLGCVSDECVPVTVEVIPHVPADFDFDLDVDSDDWATFVGCASGPGIVHSGSETCRAADFDGDHDIDQDDFARFQRCWSGSRLVRPGCME